MNQAASRLELPKILSQLAEHAVLEQTKRMLPLLEPVREVESARLLLS